MLQLDGRQVQLLQFWLCSANHVIYYYEIYHKSNENTDKYKNQREAAVVLIKIYFYDYITWFSEPCAVCNNCNDCYVVYIHHSPALR